MITRLLFAVCLLFASFSGWSKGGDEPGMVLIQGRVYEIGLRGENRKPAPDVQILIYQDNEIYAAFFAKKTGDYEFYLPLGSTFEVCFGGSAFVNKKVFIDSRNVPPHLEAEINADIGIFRPVEGVSFDVLNEHFVRFGWESEYNRFIPDLKYGELRSRELDKIIRRLPKQ